MTNLTYKDLYILQYKYDANISENFKFHRCNAQGIIETKKLNYDLYRLSLNDDKLRYQNI